MDRESIVYGCIKDLPSGSENEILKRRYHNLRVINSLPKHDEWPFLSRDLFAVSGVEPSYGTYLTQVIHFGASYRDVEGDWGQWLQKFEAVLKKMYWVAATVHLETELTGFHTFSWFTNNSCHLPDEELQARCEWQHESWVKTNASQAKSTSCSASTDVA
ncbi:hypothetical protein KCM76_13880 [Zooshikella marina]|uniref:Uncharacterized protein n=1 Tax=Zooshikella ganghwensis TaxID=202772 RepID=A0A4V1INE5_9GAMM|nr:hypothetical protein [Zooshikella ganghwensis]MBU2707080.1 hypothetical protein [Zooshikella ganghwensis]RDH43451.1 hypothetical protein B9G39_08370 [Zooshikella ganghwensis]